MNSRESKRKQGLIETAAESYKKGWEIAFAFMESSHTNKKWAKKMKGTS